MRVSADRAARLSPHTRGKPRLLDVGRRIPARAGFGAKSRKIYGKTAAGKASLVPTLGQHIEGDREFADSPLEEGGFELAVPPLMDQHISRLDTNTDDSGQQPNHGVGPGLRLLLQSFLTSFLDLPDLAHNKAQPRHIPLQLR